MMSQPPRAVTALCVCPHAPANPRLADLLRKGFMSTTLLSQGIPKHASPE